MDRDEKIARLEAWLKNNEYQQNKGSCRRIPLDGSALEEATRDRSYPWVSDKDKREISAVRHELQRQEDKKIIKELGIFRG